MKAVFLFVLAVAVNAQSECYGLNETACVAAGGCHYYKDHGCTVVCGPCATCDEGSGKCLTCAAGSEIDGDDCRLCGTGTYSADGVRCVACELGEGCAACDYTDGLCSDCRAGSALNGTGCVECLEGLWSKGGTQKECEVCPALCRKCNKQTGECENNTMMNLSILGGVVFVLLALTVLIVIRARKRTRMDQRAREERQPLLIHNGHLVSE